MDEVNSKESKFREHDELDEESDEEFLNDLFNDKK